MEILYKYYSNESKYSLENLKNANISFSPLETLNDPYEGVGAYLLQVSDKGQKNNDYNINKLDKLITKKITGNLYEENNFYYRVFCSSKNYNNTLLWSYYANEHKGFCVGYEEKDLLEITDEILDIKYSNNMCIINEYSENTLKELLTTKYTDWSIENERRVLYKLKEDDIKKLDSKVYYENNKNTEDKLYKLSGYANQDNVCALCSDKFIIFKCKPSVIYMGLKMEHHDKKCIIKIAEKFNIKLYQMSQKENSFELIAKEYIEGDSEKC